MDHWLLFILRLFLDITIRSESLLHSWKVGVLLIPTSVYCQHVKCFTIYWIWILYPFFKYTIILLFNCCLSCMYWVTWEWRFLNKRVFWLVYGCKFWTTGGNYYFFIWRINGSRYRLIHGIFWCNWRTGFLPFICSLKHLKLFIQYATIVKCSEAMLQYQCTVHWIILITHRIRWRKLFLRYLILLKIWH